MAKAKGTKAAAKANRKDAKPAPKAAPAKPASKAAKPPAKAAAKPAAKPAPKAVAKPAAKATKPVAEAIKPSKPPVAAAKPEALAASVDPTSEGFIIKKKKVKRGAPPMLPRRVPRRALPPLEAGAVLPPPKPTTPGSLHAPARTPEGAEKLKANLTRAINALQRLKALKRNIQRQFWDAALTLHELSQPDLYQAKGYGSWESFLEREVERELGIGRVQAMDLVKIVKIFQREAAEEIGLEKLRKALREIYPEQGSQSPAPTTGASG